MQYICSKFRIRRHSLKLIITRWRDWNESSHIKHRTIRSRAWNRVAINNVLGEMVMFGMALKRTETRRWVTILKSALCGYFIGKLQPETQFMRGSQRALELFRAQLWISLIWILHTTVNTKTFTKTEFLDRVLLSRGIQQWQLHRKYGIDIDSL